MLRQIWDGLIDLLAPPTCAACNSSLSGREEGFCPGCAPLIDDFPNPEGSLDRAVCMYGGPLAQAIARLKYQGASHVAKTLSGLLKDAVEPFVGRCDCVCVVPIHRQRLVARGFNQSALLAGPVADALGVAFEPSLLIRWRKTLNQVDASPALRRVQLVESMYAAARARGKRVLVVDDVSTTGATLHEAQRALSEAGAQQIHSLVLARVHHPAAAEQATILSA